MKTKLLSLFVALVATTALWASNTITYIATEKLQEITEEWLDGFHINAFNEAITSHDFANSTGTITFAGEVTTIGNQAFYGCSGLTSITIPNSVTTIGNYAFYDCEGLTSITIPNSVTTIGDYAFQSCSGVISVTIGNSVTTIEERAFKGCTGLASITIPNSVTTIGVEAFGACRGLTSIKIPNSVTTIGDGAFYCCSGLTSIVVDSENTRYDSRNNCNAIIRTSTNTLIAGCKNTTIPSSVTTIEEYAFRGCTGLTSITIPSSVISFDYRVFSGCDNLTSINVELGNPKHDSRDNCNAIIETATNTLIIGCQNTTIPSSVTTIGNYAFYDCEGLTSITIPNSVTTIGISAFVGCSGLTSITCEATTPPTCSLGCFTNVDHSIPLYVPAASIDAYKTTNEWKDFTNIQAIPIPNNVITYTATGKLTNSTLDVGATTFGPAITSHTFSNGTGTITCSCEITSIGYANFKQCIGLISVTIPNSVTTIGQQAFQECTDLTSVTIGSSVTSIGYDAFSGCSSLTSINIPSSVISIGDNAFFNCSNLTFISIPSSVTSIGGSAFSNCSNLISVTISSSVTTIEEYAFRGCTGLTSITCEATTPPTCGSQCFEYVDHTIPLYVPAASIEAYKAANHWKDFTNIQAIPIIPNNTITYTATKKLRETTEFLFVGLHTNAFNVSIISHTFDDGIGTITFVGDVTSIGNCAFLYCNDLTSVTIPSSVTSIGDNAFFDCSLTSITIPSSVISIGIGSNIFQMCSSMTSINVEPGNTKYDSRDHCNAIIETATSTLVTGCMNTIIPSSVTSIGKMAFRGCENLISVIIPSSVTIIENSAFSSCTGLTSITCEATTPPTCRSSCFENVDHIIPLYVPAASIDAYKTADEWKDFTNIQAIPSTPSTNNIITYTATSKLTETTSTYSYGLHTNAFNVSIISHTFNDDQGTITFAGDVTTIGDEAFFNCRGLTSITIPNSVTTIGNNAFSGCTGLTSITIPNSVTTIGDGAFDSCSGLTSPVYNANCFAYMPTSYGAYTIPDGIKQIAGSAFQGCTGLTSITIPNSVTTIGNRAFKSCTNLESINIPSSVTSIEECTFIYCSGLTSITIPSSVTTIGECAFSHCRGLTSVTIPSSVTTIGDGAFSWCSGLTSITIPNSVTTIGEGPFSGCHGLTSIVVDTENTKYDSRDNCNAIIETTSNTLLAGCKNTTIPNSVKTIGNRAFKSCANLESITIPNSVTSIGEEAFYGCSGLTSVTIPNSVTTIGDYAFFFVNNIVYSGTATGSPWGAKCVNGYVDGYLVYSDATKTTLCGCSSAATGVITIPNSVTTIGDYAFQSCSGLTSITIPSSVTTIGKSAFSSCSGLTSIKIPNSVTTIGNEAFSWCSSLTSITCEATTPPTCGSFCFEYVDYSIPVYVPAESVEAYKTANEWKDFTNIQAIPTAVTYDLQGGVTNEYGWQNGEDMYQALAADILKSSTDGVCTAWSFASEFPSRGTFDTPDLNGGTGVANDVRTFDLTFWATEPYASRWGWLADYIDAADIAAGQSSTIKTNSAYARYSLAAFFANSVRTSWPKTADYIRYGVANIASWQTYWKHGWDNPTEFDADEEFILNTPYKEGETFNGWFLDPEGEGQQIIKMSSAYYGQTVYAVFGEYQPTIKEIRDTALYKIGDKVTTTATIIAVGNTKVFIADASGMGIMALYGESQQNNLEAGLLLTITGELAEDNGFYYLKDCVTKRVLPMGATIKPYTTTLADLKANPLKYYSLPVLVKDIRISKYDADGDMYVSDGVIEMECYYIRPNQNEYETGQRINLTAAVGNHMADVQFVGTVDGIEKLVYEPKKDPNTYEPLIFTDKGTKYTYTIQNNWIISANMGNWEANKPAPQLEQCRGMVVKDGIIYFPWRSSNTPNDHLKLVRYDAATGERLDDLILAEYIFQQPAADDSANPRWYRNNQTGLTYIKDDYKWNYAEFNQGYTFGPNTGMYMDEAGHILVADLPTNGGEYQVWMIDEKTGEGQLVIYCGGNSGASTLKERYPDDADIYLSRFGVAGDVTKNATIFAANLNSDKVYTFDITNGKWNGEMWQTAVGGGSISNYGQAPQINPVDGGESFYVSGTTLYPTLVAAEDGTILESFNGTYDEKENPIRESCVSLLYSEDMNAAMRVAGCREFKVGGAYFFSMSAATWEGGYTPHNSHLLFRFKDRKRHFDEMTRWTELPKDGFGTIDDVKNYQFTNVHFAVEKDALTTELYIWTAEYGLAKYTITADKFYEDSIAKVTASVENGKLNGAGYYVKGDTCTLTVTPNTGYQFTQWTDGNTDNPRTFVVTQDTTFSAELSPSNNVITYTATEKLTNSTLDIGSTTFGATITSHTFTSGQGTITFDSDVTEIGWSAFASCRDLTSITIPSSVISIGFGAFWQCTGLTSITIPSSVSSIEDWAFYRCTGLTSIHVESDNPKYDSRDNCNALIETATNTLIIGCQNTTIPSSVSSIKQNAFDGCTGLTSIIIPSSVTTIGEAAFYECSGLTSITIPSSVTKIEDGAFEYCIGLTSIHVESDNPKYDSRDNCNALIETATNTLLTGCKNTTIPSSITSIGEFAFFICSGLTSINIPSSVTTIEKQAFRECIGLTSITIPSSVTEIGYWAFFKCTGLTSITCKAITPPTCEDLCFEDVNHSIPLYVPAASIEAYKTANEWKDFTNIQAIPTTYYVRYHAEDATSGSMELSQHTYGTPSHLSKNTFVREGYQFLGWTTGATNEVEYADEAEILNLTTTPNAIVHLYAVWGLSSITLYDRPTGEQTWQQAAEHLQAQLTDLKNKCDADPTLTCDVRIVRTIAHNGVLTPICLPFSLSADEISNASSPLHQAYIYSFDCRVQKNSDEVEVRMRRQNHIIAGVPYVIKFTQGNDQDYFDFKDVRITVDEPLTDESTAMDFVGNFLPIPLESSENILYVTTDGSLCWWDSSIDDGVTYLRGFRAHFVINTPALKSIHRGMKVVMVEQEDTDTPTDLDWVKNAENGENTNAHPQKVIIDNQLYIISHGKTYNALGNIVK